jgi:hypothetical protein
MSTLEERKENDLKAAFIIQKAAGDNKEAKEYLEMLSVCARIVDDIFDEFESVTQQHLLTLVEIFFIRMPANYFYQQHKDQLFSQHVTMWNAWEISNVLEKEIQQIKYMRTY